MHGGQPVPSRGQSKSERCGQRPYEEGYPKLPGSGRIRRKGVRGRAFGTQGFLLFHYGIHRWYRGVLERRPRDGFPSSALSFPSRPDPTAGRTFSPSPRPFSYGWDEATRAPALSRDSPTELRADSLYHSTRNRKNQHIIYIQFSIYQSAFIRVCNA